MSGRRAGTALHDSRIRHVTVLTPQEVLARGVTAVLKTNVYSVAHEPDMLLMISRALNELAYLPLLPQCNLWKKILARIWARRNRSVYRFLIKCSWRYKIPPKRVAAPNVVMHDTKSVYVKCLKT